MSCLISTPKLEKLADRFFDETVETITNAVGTWQDFNRKKLEDLPTAEELADFLKITRGERPRLKEFGWEQFADNSFEISTAANKSGVTGDSRFSALNATFKPGTIVEGVDVSGKTIEYAYQNLFKKSRKGRGPAEDSVLIFNPALRPEDENFLNTLSAYLGKIIRSNYIGEKKAPKERLEDYSYYRAYLPLWQEWARQNPQLIEELRQKAKGKILTDRFANTRVSQARALADILSSTTVQQQPVNQSKQGSGRTITYTPIGKTQQTYNIRKGDDGTYHIFNRKGKEVFKEDSKDRRRIFANLAVKEDRAVVVAYKDKKYVVNNKEQIISATTGDLMQWGPENGDRRAIVTEARRKFREKKEASTNRTATRFSTSSKPSYSQRTIENADWSTVTIAFAENFNTAGESLTAWAAGSVDPNFLKGRDTRANVPDKYIPYKLVRGGEHAFDSSDILEAIEEKELPTTNIRLNIAGNSINSTSWNQNELNDYITYIIQGLLDQGVTIAEIRSGGQTGVDEAGIIAAQRLGIPNEVHTTANYTFRDKSGKDVSDEQAFKSRFMSAPTQQFASIQEQGTFKELLNQQQPSTPQETFLAPIEDIKYETLEEALQSEQESEKRDLSAAANIPEVQGLSDIDAQRAVDLTFDPQVRRDRVVMLARLFSNRIDVLLEVHKKDLEKLKQQAESPEKYENYQKQIDELDRKYIIDLYSPRGIFDLVYDFFKQYTEATDEERTQAEYNTINSRKGAEKISTERKMEAAKRNAEYKNAQYHKLIDDKSIWTALVEEACPILYYTEKLKISLDNKDVQYEEIGSEDPEGNSAFEDEDDSSSQEEAYKDGWMTKYQHVSSEDSLSQKVREFIMTVPKLDFNGKVEKDDLGYIRHLDASYVHATLIDRLRFMTRVEDMKMLLNSLVKTKPWVSRIIKSLDNDETLFSQFYQDFRKDFLPYWIQKRIPKPDGTFIVQTIPINFPEGTYYLLDEWRDNYESGTKLDEDSIYNESGDIDVSKARKGLKLTEALYNKFSNARSLQEKSALVEDEDTFKTILKLLNMIGINANPSVLKIGLLSIQEVEGITPTHPVMLLLPYLNVIFSKVSGGAMTETKDDFGNSVRKDLINTFSGVYNGIANILSDVTTDAIESSVRENDKQYYSHVNPSFLGKIIKNLKNVTNDPERYKQFMQTEFKNYAWFFKDNQWLNTWLAELEESEEMRMALDHKVLLNTDKVEYQDWDDLDYTLVLLNEFWAEPPQKGKSFAWYHVPILADSPSAEFIRFRRYRTGDIRDEYQNPVSYDNIILDKLVDVVNQEYNRMVIVSDRYRKFKNGDTTISPIAGYDVVWDKETGKITDKGGAEFKFIPELNTLKYEDGKTFTEKLTELKKTKGNSIEFIQFITDALRGIMEDNFEKAYKEWHSMGLFEELPNGKYRYISFEAQSKRDATLITALNKAQELLGASWTEQMATLVADLKDSKPRTTAEINSILDNIRDELQAKQDAGELEANAVAAVLRNLKYVNNSKDALREYFYNSVLATSQIIQLTTSDLAFYKNAADFQKRFKEVHTPSLRLNTEATYKGEKIGRTIERSIYLKDNTIVSHVLDDIKDIILSRHSRGEFSDYDAASILAKYGYSNYVGKDKKKYVKIGNVYVKTEKVNVADAQAYRSLSSYRAMLVMSGQWTDDMEEAYNNFRNGTWSHKDFDILWQTKKPFTFTNIKKLVGYEKVERPLIDEKTGKQKFDSEGNPLTELIDNTDKPIYARVPVQHKNSEFLLLAIYGTVAASLRNSPKLQAINQFMEDYQIDVVQFESAVKVGKQETIDLNDLQGYTEVTERLKEKTGVNTVENENVIHQIPYEDYGITTQTPEHHIDKMQMIGTQIRKLITADMSDDAVIEVDGKKLTKKEWMKLYNEVNTENILQKFLEVDAIFADPRRVEEEILNTIRGNPRYGAEMEKACKLDEDGNFTLPLFDPVMSQKIQTLLNSIIKKHITKQMIKGGSLIQVSSYGLSEDLKIVFEGEGENKRIKYFECYMPAYSKKFFEPLMDPKTHQLDINKLPDELRKIIGYRVPTEYHYSMAPLYIKGFLPQQNGSAIMLPAEITTIAGSDFDRSMLK